MTDLFPMEMPRRRLPPPPVVDPTEPVYLVLNGYHHGPYSRTFAEGLRKCHTIKGSFASASIVPVDERDPRSVDPRSEYHRWGAW